MHKIENILFGIALILFGIAALPLAEYTGWGLFELFAVLCPIGGIAFTILAMIYNGPKDKTEE